MSPILLPYYHVESVLLQKKHIVLVIFYSHEILAFEMSKSSRGKSKFSLKNEMKSKRNIFWFIKTSKKYVDNLTRSTMTDRGEIYSKIQISKKFTSGKNIRWTSSNKGFGMREWSQTWETEENHNIISYHYTTIWHIFCKIKKRRMKVPWTGTNVYQ